jgi:hypothetical protein
MHATWWAGRPPRHEYALTAIDRRLFHHPPPRHLESYMQLGLSRLTSRSGPSRSATYPPHGVTPERIR